MATAEECRRRAQECVEFAQSARDIDRRTFLQLAETWLKLADEFALPGLTANAPITHKMQ